MAKRICVVGSFNTDMIVKTSRIPAIGETVIGGEFTMAPGGKGANQAVSAAKAGGAVTFIARVGDDLFGKQAIDRFQHEGIDTGYVLKDAGAATGVALIMVDDAGQNSIAVASGANRNLTPSDIMGAEDAIASSEIVILQLETPFETVQKAAALAARHGVPVILNPAPVHDWDDEILQHLSVLTPNESEARQLTGMTIENERDAAKAAKALAARGVETVLITLGARGVFVCGPGCSESVRGFAVKAVDTTAAGDVFNGALAVALAEAKPLKEAIVFANAAAAISVTRLGAQPSAPPREEIDTFLETH